MKYYGKALDETILQLISMAADEVSLGRGRDRNAITKKGTVKPRPVACGSASPNFRVVSEEKIYDFLPVLWYTTSAGVNFMQGKITNETEVSVQEFADILGLSPRRIRQLVKEGVLEKTSQGGFLVCDSVQRYIAFRFGEPLTDEEISLEQEQREAEVLLKVSKAQMAKMEVEELRGKMHRSEDVANMTEDLIYEIRGALMALPGRLAIDTAAAETPSEASDVVRREVNKVMDGLSKYRYDPEKYRECVRERRNWEPVNGSEAYDAIVAD